VGAGVGGVVFLAHFESLTLALFLSLGISVGFVLL
jgi:hypothetical protein